MIKSALLTAALEEAYANRQMKGKFPGCVLHIDLPLHEVDVNVHPAKTVVKFVHERAVFSAVHHTVKDALDGGRPAGGQQAAGTAGRMPAGRTDGVPQAGQMAGLPKTGQQAAGSVVRMPPGHPDDVPQTGRGKDAPMPAPSPAPRGDFFQSMDAKAFRERAAAPRTGGGERQIGRAHV